MKTTFKALAVGVALIAAGGGCQTFTGRTAGEIFENKNIVGTVKTKLVRDRFQNLTWVNVEAHDGVVYLTGTAETPAQKARATELAEETSGVKRVVNDIRVKGAPTETASARTAPAASTSSSAASTARSSTAAPAASPATTTTSGAAAGTIAGEVVTVDQGTGNVTLRMASGDVQLRLPPSSVRNVKPGDRLSVSVSSVAR